MSRNTHAWFLAGMILSFLVIIAAWLSALVLGQLWASEWGVLIPFADVFIFATAIFAWRRRSQKMRRAAIYSRETRCQWFARITPVH